MSLSASFSSASFTPDRLVISLDDVVSRKVTIAAGQNLVRGAVIGKITTGGKYSLSASAASDGSQTPDAILADDCNATAADTEAMAYFRVQVNSAAVTLGAGHTVASIREGLRGKGIDLIDTVGNA